MKCKLFLFAVIAGLLLTGCARSHQQHTAFARPAEAVVLPTSDRPEVRVYTNDTNTAVIPDSPPARVVVTPVGEKREVANRIRRLFETDPALALKARNSSITVDGGRVTLRGFVEREEDRQMLRDRIGQIAGVESVDTTESVVTPRERDTNKEDK